MRPLGRHEETISLSHPLTPHPIGCILTSVTTKGDAMERSRDTIARDIADFLSHWVIEAVPHPPLLIHFGTLVDDNETTFGDLVQEYMREIVRIENAANN